MADRNLYPHLRGRQAKQRIARERREAEELARRFDDREVERAASDLAARVNARLTAEPDARVRAMIERDRADHMREIERAADGIILTQGDVTTPTPEWFQHGDVEDFSVDAPDRTAISLKTKRRVLTPIVLRMLKADKIDSDQYRALAWYADTYEAAGLLGNIPIVQIGREVFGGGPDRVLFTEAQQIAQDQLRQAKAVITPARVRFFEAVVIGNVPIERASKFVRTRRGNALKIFKNEAQKMTAELFRLGILA